MRPPLCGRVGITASKGCPYMHNFLLKRSARPGARVGRLLNSQETRKPLSSVSTQKIRSAVESLSAASSWPESLIAVLGRRAIHVFFVVRLCAPPPQMFVHRDLARPLSVRAATPSTPACSVTRHLSPRPQWRAGGLVVASVGEAA